MILLEEMNVSSSTTMHQFKTTNFKTDAMEAHDMMEMDGDGVLCLHLLREG